MKHLPLLLSIICFSHIQAQESLKKFGQINMDDIKLTTYEQDPDAGAVIIFDLGKSEFIDSENGYNIRFTRHKRVKILNRSEFSYAEISIPFYTDGYNKSEEVKSIEAITFNYVDGQVDSQILDPATVYEEKLNERWNNKKFVFPNVQEGSILELRYVVETPFHFNLPDWVFQDKIPTLYSEYVVSMIPFYEYVYLAQGISHFDYQNSVVSDEKRTWGTVVKGYGNDLGDGIEFHDFVHTYVMKDVPAFKDESYISSINDYIIKIEFQLARFYNPRGGTTEIISSWPALNKSLLKNVNFGKYQSSCSRFTKQVLAETINLADDSVMEKINKIIEYVKGSFTWDGQKSKYASKSAKEFFSTKAGNSADINLFLIALLNSAGISAQPVILSTRDHGKFRTDYPFDHLTNYVLALISTESPFLADGTDIQLAFDRIPLRCFNERALVVNEDEDINWLVLDNKTPSYEKKSILIKPDPDSLTASVNLSIQSTEYDAYNIRNTYKDDSLSLISYYSPKVGNISELATFNYDDILLPYIVSIKGNCELERIGDNLLLNPFLNLSISKNNLTQKNRTYPVDLIYPSNELFDITIDVPAGFRVVSIPELYKMDNNLSTVMLDYSTEGNIVKIIGNYEFKKAEYSSNEYARIKFYLDTIVKKFNQKIIFEKM